MKIEELTLFAIAATAIFVTATLAIPLKSFKTDEPEARLMDLPAIEYWTNGIPKYIQDIKEIIASPHPIQTAFFKIREILPKRVEISDSLVLQDTPDVKLIGISIEKIDNNNNLDIPAVPLESLTNALENTDETSTEKSDVMGEDPNQPYEEVLDWALKTLGYVDTNTDDTSSVQEDPVLRDEKDFRINYEGNINAIDEKSKEAAASPSEIHRPIFK